MNEMAQQSDPLSEVTLAILAGGAGSRMGMAKADLRIGSEPILGFLLRRLAWPGPTLLVTAPGREHPPGWEGFTREVADPVGGLGPLRGVLTALEFAATPQVVVTPVDMPGVAFPQLRWLASAFSMERSRRRDVCGLMTCREMGPRPGWDGPERRTEPFPAAFHRDAAAPIRARLEAGRGSVQEIAAEPGFIVAAAPDTWAEAAWVNLNRPADLQAFLESVGKSMA